MNDRDMRMTSRRSPDVVLYGKSTRIRSALVVDCQAQHDEKSEIKFDRLGTLVQGDHSDQTTSVRSS